MALLALLFPTLLHANILAIEFRRGVTYGQTDSQAPTLPLFYDVSSDIRMVNDGVASALEFTSPNGVSGNFTRTGPLDWHFSYAHADFSVYTSVVPDGPGPYQLQFSGGSVGTFTGSFVLQSAQEFSPTLPYLSAAEFAHLKNTFDPSQAFTVHPLTTTLTDPMFGGTMSPTTGIGVMIWDPANYSQGGIHYGATIPALTLQEGKEYELFMWTQTDFVSQSGFNPVTSSPDAASTVNMTINKFKFTTVPEPSALSLLAVALGTLFRPRRKGD